MDAFVGKPLTPEKLRKVLLDAGRRLLGATPVQVPQEMVNVELDMNLLTYLSDGTAEGVESQIQRFLATMDDTETAIGSAAAAQDFAQLAESAHHLLGQARLINRLTMIEATTRLEVAARSRNASACEQWLQRVRDEIEEVTEAMHHRRSGAPSE
jgi:HPt (histidine-containing phosphotransfer) domain-containing protein